MLHPSYTDLIRIVNDEAESDTPVVNSRYTIVMATAKRARQIIAEGENQTDFSYDHAKLKPLSQAVKELSEGSLRIIPENAPDEEETAAEEMIAEEAVQEPETIAEQEVSDTPAEEGISE